MTRAPWQRKSVAEGTPHNPVNAATGFSRPGHSACEGDVKPARGFVIPVRSPTRRAVDVAQLRSATQLTRNGRSREHAISSLLSARSFDFSTSMLDSVHIMGLKSGVSIQRGHRLPIATIPARRS